MLRVGVLTARSCIDEVGVHGCNQSAIEETKRRTQLNHVERLSIVASVVATESMALMSLRLHGWFHRVPRLVALAPSFFRAIVSVGLDGLDGVMS